MPGKNLRKLGKQTLTHRALYSAINTKIFDEVILTTDIPFFLEEQDTPWRVRHRPEELCLDDTPMSAVISDTIQWAEIKNNDMIWLLQPTSPFRVAEDFFSILHILGWNDVDAVISVTPVSSHHPSRFYRLSALNKLVPLAGKLANFDNRQNLKDVYWRNGLFYVVRCEAFKKSKNFFAGEYDRKGRVTSKTCCLMIDSDRSNNIDSERDFLHAQVDFADLCSRKVITP